MPMHWVHQHVKKVLWMVLKLKFGPSLIFDRANSECKGLSLDLASLLVFCDCHQVFVEVFGLSEVLGNIIIELTHGPAYG